MNIAIHILKFITATALGFFSIVGIMAGALQFGVIDALPADEHIYNFRLFYLGGGMLTLILSTLVGASTFLTHGRASTIFMLLPLVIPVLYCIVVLTYFSNLS